VTDYIRLRDTEGLKAEVHHVLRDLATALRNSRSSALLTSLADERRPSHR
jgi:hypothetical protein